MTADHDSSRSDRAPVALVTGASRGIGAATARQLAARGARVVVNFRQKQRRADDVVAQIRAHGGSASAIRADLTHTAQVRSMFATIDEQFGPLDILVLNASGGMEREAEPGYAMHLNRDAQLFVLEEALIRMPAGGRVVCVTSHQAHFHGQQPGPPAYEAVAASKRAGEDAIRAQLSHMTRLGVSLVVVSGDMIDGTITVTLLNRANPGLLEERRRDVGDLPTIDEFATAVTAATTSTLHPDTPSTSAAPTISPEQRLIGHALNTRKDSGLRARRTPNPRIGTRSGLTWGPSATIRCLGTVSIVVAIVYVRHPFVHVLPVPRQTRPTTRGHA